VSFDDQPRCEGSLIAPDWVLTAASCLTLLPANSYSVQLASGEVAKVQELVVHPSFLPGDANAHSNVGLMHLSTSVILSAAVDVIRPSNDADAVGTSVLAVGYTLSTNGDPGKTESGLKQASLSVVPQTSCEAMSSSSRRIFPDELCAGVEELSASVCFRDAGSALVSERAAGIWEHIGLPVAASAVSTGQACHPYTVFSRTNSVVSFIRENAPDAAWVPALNQTGL
jgi:secreted trypsin-like serine protease